MWPHFVSDCDTRTMKGPAPVQDLKGTRASATNANEMCTQSAHHAGTLEVVDDRKAALLKKP